MNVSPLDLRQAKFNTALRGFDKIEVTSFLMAAADDYEQALRETDKLRQDVSRMEAVLNEYREHEKSLKSTLMAAQKLADDITGNAEEEAKRVVREAQGRSDLLLEKTQARLEDVQREIDGLKLKRRDVETSIEATIQIALLIGGVIVGLALLKTGVSWPVLLTKIYLVANALLNLALAVVYFGTDLPEFTRTSLIAKGIITGVLVSIVCFLWFMYFIRSKRVQATYFAQH